MTSSDKTPPVSAAPQQTPATPSGSAGRIVVGVDGSPASVEALRWATRQAQLTGDSVEAVIAWQPPTTYGYEFFADTLDYAEVARTTLETAVGEAGDASSAEVALFVQQGHPAQILTTAAAGAHLLVVGSRGHGGFAGLLLGSVSEYVSAHADCPVLVIRPHS